MSAAHVLNFCAGVTVALATGLGLHFGSPTLYACAGITIVATVVRVATVRG